MARGVGGDGPPFGLTVRRRWALGLVAAGLGLLDAVRVTTEPLGLTFDGDTFTLGMFTFVVAMLVLPHVGGLPGIPPLTLADTAALGRWLLDERGVASTHAAPGDLPASAAVALDGLHEALRRRLVADGADVARLTVGRALHAARERRLLDAETHRFLAAAVPQLDRARTTATVPGAVEDTAAVVAAVDALAARL